MAESRKLKLAPITDNQTNPENEELKGFMLGVAVAQGYVKNIYNNARKLEQLKSQLVNSISDKEKESSNQIENIIDVTAVLQQKTKIIIDQNAKFAKDSENNTDLLEQEKRIISNLHGSLIKNFSDTVSDYQAVQSDIINVKQEKTLRNAELVIGRKLDENEKEKVISDPNVVQEIFKSKLTEGGSTKFLNDLADIEDRHNDIVKLEKSVNQVHQLFLELAALVSLQGEIVDNIYENIEKAKEDVFHAEEDVIQSKKNMISARKKKCCILVIALVVIVAICGSVLGVNLGSA